MAFCKHCNLNVLTIVCGNCGRRMPEHERYNRHAKGKKRVVADAEPASVVGDVLTEADLKKAVEANRV